MENLGKIVFIKSREKKTNILFIRNLHENDEDHALTVNKNIISIFKEMNLKTKILNKC